MVAMLLHIPAIASNNNRLTQPWTHATPLTKDGCTEAVEIGGDDLPEIRTWVDPVECNLAPIAEWKWQVAGTLRIIPA